MKNVEVEIIDFTRDEVYYFEDVWEAKEKLEELELTCPTHDIGLRQFSVFGIELPYSEENVEFIKETDAETLEEVMTFYEFEFGIVPDICYISLETVFDCMLSTDIRYIIADNEVDAFVEFYKNFWSLEEIPSNLINHIGWNKLLEAYKIDGLGVYRLSYNHPTKHRYMFCY